MASDSPEQVRKKVVDNPTTKSLFVEAYFEDVLLGTATGFVVSSESGHWLVTARHVFTGRHHDTGIPMHKSCGIPNRLVVWLIRGSTLGYWQPCELPILTKDGQPRWVEHPRLGAKADIAALALNVPDGTRVKPYDIRPIEDPLQVGPASIVSVVGYPFGLTASGRFAIWATGFVATDLDLDFSDLPIFLIDCRSRSGQSGSPVIAHRKGYFSTMQGLNYAGGNRTELLGVYSGRVNADSDLGFVWKVSAVRALVSGTPVAS